MKPCIYCHRGVDISTREGYLYVIEDDEQVTMAHQECDEVYDGITINETEQSWQD